MIPDALPFPPALPPRIVEIWCQATLELLQTIDTAAPYAVISPPDTGWMTGWPWWKELTAELSVPTIFDCGHAAGLAAAALRERQAYIVFHGTPEQDRTIHALARQCGAEVFRTRPEVFSPGIPPYDAYRQTRLMTYLNPPFSGQTESS